MNRAASDADLRRERYEIGAGEIGPQEGGMRTILTPASWCWRDRSRWSFAVLHEYRCCYGPGDTCDLPAGALHEQQTAAPIGSLS